jgi:hypothetical protein
MGIKEGEEVQTKGIHNIFNKIIAENFKILRKSCPFRYRKLPGHQIVLIKVNPVHSILSLKQLAQSTEKEY